MVRVSLDNVPDKAFKSFALSLTDVTEVPTFVQREGIPLLQAVGFLSHVPLGLCLIKEVVCAVTALMDTSTFVDSTPKLSSRIFLLLVWNEAFQDFIADLPLSIAPPNYLCLARHGGPNLHFGSQLVSQIV